MTETTANTGKISKFLGAFLALVLILSFALWGVEDIFRKGLSGNVAATVGGEEIPLSEYERAVSVETRRLEMQLGQAISEDALKHYQIPQQTMAVLINQSLFRQQTEQLGLNLGDERVVQSIRSDERLLSKDGTFDRPTFDRMLKMYGYTERSYVESVRGDIERGVMLSAFTAFAPLVKEEISALYRHREEKRTASVLTISTAQVKDIKEPTDQEIQDYYAKNKERFSTFEVRNVSYLTFSSADIAHEMDMSEEALRTEYKFREDEFAPKEKRALAQLLVQDEAKAKEVAALLKKLSLKDAAKKVGVADDVSDIGTFTPEDLAATGIIPKDAITEAFLTEKGKATQPFKSPLGWHILGVTGIDKGKGITFEEAKPRLKEFLLKDKGGDLLYELSTQVEDKIAGGAALEEIASTLSLKLNTITGLTPDGKAKDGATLPEFPNFMEKALLTEKDKLSDLVPNAENSAYFVLRVDGITPSRIKALEEVRAEVVSAWKKEQQQARLKTLAEEVATKLKGGATLEQEAASLGVKLSTLGPVRRDYQEPDKTTATAVKELFTLAKGKTGSAQAQGVDYVIFRSDSIIPPEEKDRQMAEAALSGELKEAYAQDIQEQMIIHLRTTRPVKQYVGQ